jgi:hypothetical protein
MGATAQPEARSTAPTGAIRPNSRPSALAKLDLRTREARLMRDTRAELIAHVSGNSGILSTTQRALVEQAVQIKLRLAVMDRAFAVSANMTAHDSKQYLAWSNSFTRLMRQLGLQGVQEKPQTLTDYLAERGRERAAAEAA